MCLLQTKRSVCGITRQSYQLKADVQHKLNFQALEKARKPAPLLFCHALTSKTSLSTAGHTLKVHPFVDWAPPPADQNCKMPFDFYLRKSPINRSMYTATAGTKMSPGVNYCLLRNARLECATQHFNSTSNIWTRYFKLRLETSLSTKGTAEAKEHGLFSSSYSQLTEKSTFLYRNTYQHYC